MFLGNVSQAEDCYYLMLEAGLHVFGLRLGADGVPGCYGSSRGNYDQLSTLGALVPVPQSQCSTPCVAPQARHRVCGGVGAMSVYLDRLGVCAGWHGFGCGCGQG